MHFTVLTIFPEIFDSFRAHGIIRRAIEGKKIVTSTINIRDYATDRHQMTDDRPYGGGSGMVMKPEPLAAAIRAAKEKAPSSKSILMTPQGRVFNQHMAQQLTTFSGLILICGRYEGVDERIVHDLVDDEISIGDYILTGGELAAMVVIETVTRLIPGTLGSEASAENDSFSEGFLEHAHYTRPRNFEGKQVPEVLVSGHHQEIEQWRRESSVMQTLLKRPDLLRNRKLSESELEILYKWYHELGSLLNINHKEKKADK
ncbi:MAG: tRNA (guanosine(37)-N1)-methyltransferase TrmD [Desulfobacterales bacterium]|jgi:tRNA (guanine37-N1)-methyltransferase